MAAPPKLPPFDLRALLRDKDALLARVELAFALARPHRLAVRPPSAPKPERR